MLEEADFWEIVVGDGCGIGRPKRGMFSDRINRIRARGPSCDPVKANSSYPGFHWGLGAHALNPEP